MAGQFTICLLILNKGMCILSQKQCLGLWKIGSVFAVVVTVRRRNVQPVSFITDSEITAIACDFILFCVDSDL